MERLDAESIALYSSASIHEAMSLLDRTAKQIVLVVGPTRKLVGLVTDGDIRRGLLGSVSLTDPVSLVMNQSFHFVHAEYELPLVLSLMASRGIRHLPVLNHNGVAVEVLKQSDQGPTSQRPNPIVIMAGGRGSRLRPLTDEVPKPMLSVGGVPILEIVLRNYASQGFKNFLVSVGYLGKQIENHFGDGSFLNVNISYLREDQPLGTAGALSAMSCTSDQPFLVSNADVISSIDLVNLLEIHAAGQFDMTVATRRSELQVQYGVLEIENDRITSWREKPKIPMFISAGIYAMNVEVLQNLPVGYADIPDLVDQLITEGRSVGSFELDGLWIDVGSREELEVATEIGRLYTRGDGFV